MDKLKVQELTIDGTVYVPKDSTKTIELNGQESVWEVGKNYLIRTVTMTQLGKLEKVTDKELVLSQASWVADTGRFSNALSTGALNEVEMLSDIILRQKEYPEINLIVKSLPISTPTNDIDNIINSLDNKKDIRDKKIRSIIEEEPKKTKADVLRKTLSLKPMMKKFFRYIKI